MFSRKALSAVVAVILLAIVAVTSSIAFQTFYFSFQSEKLVLAEDRSNISSMEETIYSVEEGIIFFKSGSNTQIRDVIVGDISCNVSGSVSTGINELTLSNCDSNLTTGAQAVRILTNVSVIDGYVYLDQETVDASNENNLSIDSAPAAFSFTDETNVNFSTLTSSENITFEINSHKKKILLEGLDDIAQTLQFEEKISSFEEKSTIPSVL